MTNAFKMCSAGFQDWGREALTKQMPLFEVSRNTNEDKHKQFIIQKANDIIFSRNTEFQNYKASVLHIKPGISWAKYIQQQIPSESLAEGE